MTLFLEGLRFSVYQYPKNMEIRKASAPHRDITLMSEKTSITETQMTNGPRHMNTANASSLMFFISERYKTN